MKTEITIICNECGCDDWLYHEKMRRVTGQEDGLNEEVTVVKCRVFGHKQIE